MQFFKSSGKDGLIAKGSNDFRRRTMACLDFAQRAKSNCQRAFQPRAVRTALVQSVSASRCPKMVR